jgi:hypothetical protein
MSPSTYDTLRKLDFGSAENSCKNFKYCYFKLHPSYYNNSGSMKGASTINKETAHGSKICQENTSATLHTSVGAANT